MISRHVSDCLQKKSGTTDAANRALCGRGSSVLVFDPGLLIVLEKTIGVAVAGHDDFGDWGFGAPFRGVVEPAEVGGFFDLGAAGN